MLEITPISLKKANAFVANHHRHHAKVVGHKFSIAAIDGEMLVGVAIVGRPVNRHLDDGRTLEVTRLCSLGNKNVCSFLYGRCARIAKAMGYKSIITYILESESGISLIASGWEMDKEKCGGHEWNCTSRPRQVEEYSLWGHTVKYPIEKKKRYKKTL